MATRIETRSDDLYERDFYAWAKAQAALLRAGRLGEVDLEHLIEEVDDLGENLHRSVRSRVRTIIEHLLKLEHSPAHDPRAGWETTIDAQRAELEDELTASLRRRVGTELPAIHAKARMLAGRSLRRYGEAAAADALPETCPYSLDQIIGDWLP